jgi:DNA (cytosine-5)-methyltransferase 1
MKYGSLFTGIGGFDLAFDRAGMECSWQVEKDKFCRQVLQKHWPIVERFEDVKEVGKGNLSPVDLICGGFPCQNLSVVGRREGLAGKQSGLWFEYLRILDEMRPRWVVIENVPGLLSSNDGRDFATILQGLAKLRYGVSYRILDAQYFRVAQQRRRVFIVGSLGNGNSAKVLFERECGSWDFETGRETRQEVARPIVAGSHGTGRDVSIDNWICGALHNGNPGRDAQDDGNANHIIAHPLTSSSSNRYEPSSDNYVYDWQSGGDSRGLELKDKANLTSNQVQAVGVRRLTPVECEKLQGFPVGWTDICSDSQRYRQTGNAVCVPVAYWIADRIMRVDEL